MDPGTGRFAIAKSCILLPSTDHLFDVMSTSHALNLYLLTLPEDFSSSISVRSWPSRGQRMIRLVLEY